MKILLISPINKKYHLFNYYIRDYLKGKLKQEVKVLNYRKKIFPEVDRILFRSFSLLGYFNNFVIYMLFLIYCIFHKFNIIFIIKGEIFKAFFLRFIKSFNKKTVFINWFMDCPHQIDIAKRLGKSYDIFYVNCSYSVKILKFNNINAQFIPFGYIKEVFKKVKLEKSDQLRYGTDLLFIGSYSNEREEILKNLTNFQLRIHGPGWKNSQLINYVKSDGLYGSDMVKAFNAAKIIINIHQNFINRNQKRLYGNGVNLKVFEALGCHAFLLTDRKKDVLNLFKENKEIAVYSSIQELKQKIAFYLKNDNLRKKIAEQGFKSVKKYSLDKLLKIILKHG